MGNRPVPDHLRAVVASIRRGLIRSHRMRARWRTVQEAGNLRPCGHRAREVAAEHDEQACLQALDGLLAKQFDAGKGA